MSDLEDKFSVNVPKSWAWTDADLEIHDRDVANKAILENGKPFLDLATTMQLIDELQSRVEIARAADERWPTSLEVMGPYFVDTTVDLVNELKYRAHAAENIDESWPHYRKVDDKGGSE